MFPQILITMEVRRLLERHFLELADNHAKLQYARSSDHNKRVALKAFFQEKAGGTKQWATVLQDHLLPNVCP